MLCLHSHITAQCQQGSWFRAAMAKGTNLLREWALLHFKVLCLKPDGNNVKCWLRGWSVSFAVVSARRVMALWFMSERLGVGRQMILVAVCVMAVSLFLLLMVNMVKKQRELYSRMGWIILYRKATTGGEGQKTVSLWTTWSLSWDRLRTEVMCWSKLFKIFEAAHLLNCLAMDGGGVQSRVGCVWRTNDQLFYKLNHWLISGQWW